MNLAELKKALQPKLHKIEVQGIELYIHRPTMKDASKCAESLQAVLVYCVKDENGKAVFSEGESDELINVEDLDQMVANEIYLAVLNLVSTDSQLEDTEKK